MKKVIRCSNLMLRFYVEDGWTKKELDECCVEGEVMCFHPEDPNPYYTLKSGSYFDCFALMEKTSRIERNGRYSHLTDLQFLEQMNG